MNTEQHACEVTRTQNTQAPPPQTTNIEAKQKKMSMDSLEYALSKLSYHFFHKGNKCWSKLETMESLPHRHFYTFLDNNFCYCHSLHITYFQLNRHARPKCGKGLLGQGPLLWEETHTVCFSLPFSLNSPVPCSRGQMGSSRAGHGKENRSGSGPQDSDGNHGLGECSSLLLYRLPTGGVFPWNTNTQTDWRTFLKKIHFKQRKGRWPKDKEEFLPQSHSLYCSACSEPCIAHSLWL